MDSAGKNKNGTSIPSKSTMRTRRQAAAEKRKAEEELMRAEEEKRSRSIFAPREDGSIGPRDILVGQEDPAEVKVEVKLENPEDEEGQIECDGGFEGFEQIGKVEENVVVVKHEEMIDESEGASVGEHLVEVCVNLDEEEGISAKEEEGIAGGVGGISKKNITLEDVMSHIFPLLKQKDVFRCRLVNKLWRRMVDDFLEDCLVPQHYDDQAFLQNVIRSPSQLCALPKFRIVKYAYKFQSEKDLENFNEAMKNYKDSGLSPFVGGATVTLKNLFTDLLSSYHLSQATDILLKQFGVHIRRLEIQQNEMWPNEFLDCVIKFLQYVPNLERLKLIGAKYIYHTDVHRLGGGDRSGEKRQTTNLLLELYRTPKLDKLDTLELDFELECFSEDCETSTYSPYLEKTFVDIMIKPHYQSQLKILQLGWPNNLLKFNLCNVKELRLVHLQCDLKELKVLGTVEKLVLLKPYSKINFVDIFDKFPRLRYLCIDKEVLSACLTESSFTETDVHTLEIFDMKYLDCIPDNLGIVLPKLRYLILRRYEYKCIKSGVKSCLGQKSDQSFEFGRLRIADFNIGGTSYYSTVWDILPQLEILTFQFQDHMYDFKQCRECDDDLTHKHCECKFLKGTKYECPFKNIVETREGYQRYQERVPRSVTQCLTLDDSADDDSEMNPANCSRSHVSEEEKRRNSSTISALEKERCNEQAMLLVFPFLNQKDILRCRQVDKRWRRMVDDFIDKSIVPQHYDDKTYLKNVENSPNQVCPLPKFRNVEYSYHFKTERIVDQFNEMMAAHMDSELSPFIGGAKITLENLFVESPLMGPLGPALQIFLEKFGVHVRNLVIQQTEYDDLFDVVRFVEYVKLCLHFVPSLERLKVIAFGPVKTNQSEMDRIKMEVYRNEFLSRPTPKLNKLTGLQFEFSYDEIKIGDRFSFNSIRQKVPYMDEIFHDIMIKQFYQNQLKHLELSCTLRNISLKMWNLKELSLNVSTLKYLLGYYWNENKIMQGKWLEAPVEKLNLTIKSTEQILFNILRIFPFVRYLKLKDSFIYDDPNCETNIHPNNIHTLELVRTHLPDVVFRGFPKLRFLLIGQVDYNATNQGHDNYLEAFEKAEEQGQMRFVDIFCYHLFDGNGRTTYDTSIWELLPKLELFKLQSQHHKLPMCMCSYVKGSKFECPFNNFVETREGYQRYCERLSRLMKQLK